MLALADEADAREDEHLAFCLACCALLAGECLLSEKSGRAVAVAAPARTRERESDFSLAAPAFDDDDDVSHETL